MPGPLSRNEKRRASRLREAPLPDRSDLEANVRGLQRGGFQPDCVIVGTLEEGTLDDYLRVEEDWKIIRRETASHWHTGPFPHPASGSPTQPLFGERS